MSDTEISDEAVLEATGRDWQAWFELLDGWGAQDREHMAIAAFLADEHDLSGWWSQMVTVQYERERGLREVGQTASGTFQVGTQKTLPLPPERAWSQLVVAPEAVACWLGAGAPKQLAEGQRFALSDGTQCEIRVVEEGSHVRLGWHPPGWEKASTLQVRMDPSKGDRTPLRFHHEGLPDAQTREAMRAHWKHVLGELAGILERRSDRR